MYTVHGQGADFPFFIHFGNGPILVQINLQHSQAHSRYLPNSDSLYVEHSNREAVSTIFKVFGLTRPWVD